MTVRIDAVHPVLMSRDFAVSVRFFAQLGFHRTFQDNPVQPTYAAVRRDDVEVHLQWHDAHQWAYPVDRPTYRFVVSDVDACYAELASTPALDEVLRSDSPWRRPGDTPWGTREFHALDPDGNGLQFYRRRSGWRYGPHACATFAISETCDRYQSKRVDENAEVADWLVRLNTANRTWVFGLCFPYLRNINHFP